MAGLMEKEGISEEKGKQSALMKAVKKQVKKGKGNKKALAMKKEEIAGRGIIMLNHVPHGFYEKEMRSYFSQFGKVLRVRVARSKKTGKSRGYAYVEFEFQEVAKIAAEAMNNYLMFERLIKCQLLPPTTVPRKIFRDKYIREDKHPKLMARKKKLAADDIPLSKEESKNILKQRLNKLKERNQKLAEMGINYQFQLNVKERTEDEAMDEDVDVKDEVEMDEDNSAESDASSLLDEDNASESDVSFSLEEEDGDGALDMETEEMEITSPVKSPKGKGKKSISPKADMPNTPKNKSPKFSPQIGKAKTKTPEAKMSTPQIGKAKTPEAKLPTPKSGKAKTPEARMSTPQIGKAKTPEAKLPTPKSGKAKTPEAKLPTPKSGKAKTPEARMSTPKAGRDKTPEAKMPTPKIGKAKTPEAKMSTPKVGKPKTPEVKLPTPKIGNAKTPEAKMSTPKIGRDKTPEAKLPTPKTGKDKTPEAKKSKFSPKMLRSRKSQGPNVLQTPSDDQETKKAPGKAKQDKISDLPRISPKMLRSRKSEAATPSLKEKSPKLPRNRQSVGGSFNAQSADIKKTPAKGKGKTAADLPKISPKLLRSRKSDASALTPLKEKVSTPKSKKGGRKSVV